MIVLRSDLRVYTHTCMHSHMQHAHTCMYARTCMHVRTHACTHTTHTPHILYDFAKCFLLSCTVLFVKYWSVERDGEGGSGVYLGSHLPDLLQCNHYLAVYIKLYIQQRSQTLFYAGCSQEGGWIFMIHISVMPTLPYCCL